MEDVLIRFGRCCDPLPGERIVGFITRGRGVTVHTIDCPRVLESDPQRRVDVVWESGASGMRPINLEVVCVDQPGMLAAITKSISGVGVNISRAQVQSTPDKQALNSFEIVVGTADQLNKVIRAIGKLRGVIRETDEHIQRIFESTFAAAAENFNELISDVFPGGSGRGSWSGRT